jgi:hypothetical protein
MKENYFFMISKVKGREYLQIWKGQNTNHREFVKQVGSAEKLVKALEQLDNWNNLTKKYPGILTKLETAESLRNN